VVKSSREERNVRKSNIGDSDNTGDGGKIVGGAIRACGGIGECVEEKVSSTSESDRIIIGWGEKYPQHRKILLDKFQKSKPYQGAKEHRDLYDALVKSYQLDKDLFESYGNTYSLKRDYDNKDQDEDPPVGSDQGLKKQKTSKDAEPLKGSKLKESMSSSSKGSKFQPKSSSKSVQAEEPVFETTDTKMLQD
ncbi:hypothetical protein Tco_1039210, partial [Tanacetum coccineum]